MRGESFSHDTAAIDREIPADQMTSVERDALARQSAEELAPVEAGDVEQKPDGLPQPELYYGGGTGSLQTRTMAADAVTRTDGGGVVLNFVDAEIREVVNSILGDVLGESFTIDARVQGTITLRTTAELPKDAVLGVLEDVLALNGAALVKSEGVYQVIPIEMAAAAPAIIGDYGGERIDRGFGLHVIPLRHAEALKVEANIKAFVPPGRSLRADHASNVLIFVGSTAEARDISDLVATFDIDWLATRSYGLLPLRHADPEAVLEELELIFDSAEDGEGGRAVQFAVIERLKAILVVSRFPSHVEEARSWVTRLDRSLAADRQQLYIYPVQNGRAGDLAKVLGHALGIQVSAPAARNSESTLAPGLTPTAVTSGDPLDSDMMAEPLDASSDNYGGDSSDLDSTDSAFPEQTAPFDAFPASDPEIGISGDVTGPSSELDGGNVRVVASESDNALVIYATPDSYRIIEEALKGLDTAPLQTMIEATIIEVTLNDNLRYGVEWFLTQGDSTFRLSTLATGLVTPAAPGFAYLLDTGDARVVVNALSRVTDVKVISSPQLLVLNNESAQLKVGDQVPIVKKSAVSVTDPEAPVVNEVEYRDTGVILNIRPRVNSSGLVALDIMQEVSDVTATTTSGIDSPTIQQRRIVSAVAVNSGETIALGGLIRDSKSNGVQGVPVISDIPVLGNLFKTTTEEMRRTELLVLLRPRVIRDRTDARLVSQDIRSRLKALESLSQTEEPVAP